MYQNIFFSMCVRLGQALGDGDFTYMCYELRVLSSLMTTRFFFLERNQFVNKKMKLAFDRKQSGQTSLTNITNTSSDRS